jgi:putative ABC transport system permease protein
MRMKRYARELRQDLAYGARLLVRQPGFSLVALLTIALGIGATTLVFGVVHAALLAPLPYAQADRLAVVRVSLPDYEDLRAQTDVFGDSGVFASNLFNIDEEQVLGGAVSRGFFSTLGVPAMIGRVLDAGDAGVPAVVLSHGLWQRRFGAAPDVVGRTVVLSGTAYTVIGVMPPQFQFPARAFQLWVGMDALMALAPEQAQNRALRIFQAVGRLRPSLTPAEAQDRLAALASRLASTYPDTNAGISLTLVPARDRLVGNVRTALLVALGSVACLLFIACANVASLTLARMTTRVQELAMRAAMGAGRWRIVRQLASESLLMSVLGGAVGICLAWWGLRLVPALIGDRVPRIDEAGLSLPVLALSAAAIVVSGLIVAVGPMMQLSTLPLEAALRGSRGSEPRSGIRLRAGLVVTQIGLAVLVLSASLVLGRSLVRLTHVDPGFSPHRLLTFNLPLITMGTPEAEVTATTRALEAIASVPGVERAGGATALAPVTAQRSTRFEIEGRGDDPISEGRAYFIATSSDYFSTLGTPLLEGRPFAPGDTAGAPDVVIVSKSLARRLFPEGEVVGRRLRLVNPEYPGTWRTIVGVAADVRYQGLADVDPMAVYTPFVQTPFRWMYVYVRTTGDPAAAIAAIRHAVRAADTRLIVSNPQPMTVLMADSSADPLFRTTLVSLCAGAALLLAAVGLYGVIAFSVARRSREFGIRLALGAPIGSIRWSVIRHALALAIAGVGIGLLAAVATGGVLETLLYETAPRDPVALGTVVVLLIGVAVIASVIPARRATRIAPVDALRAE